MNMFTKLWDFNQDGANRWKTNERHANKRLGLVGSNLLVAFQLFGVCGLFCIAGFIAELCATQIGRHIRLVWKVRLFYTLVLKMEWTKILDCVERMSQKKFKPIKTS